MLEPLTRPDQGIVKVQSAGKNRQSSVNKDNSISEQWASPVTLMCLRGCWGTLSMSF